MATPLSVRLRHPSAWSLAMALVMGALTGLGQAPWGLWWLAVPALGAIAAQVARARTPGRAFLRAWVAGLAGFALAMHWIVEPFFVDAPRHGWMAPFALLAMTGGMALFWGMAAAFAAWGVRAPVARIWVFALAMLALEDLRGLLFTGFPWALTGHVWIGTPADQLAAPGGALLLSALSLGLAAAIGTGWLRWRQGRRVRAGVVLALAAL
ncbi:MAG: apolipoprotein N-acyltransferase, partial [Rhodobacteraceae bacterium]|nr:apolipoprotein N-acyltransferase [Paracoccaceae bacterium]